MDIPRSSFPSTCRCGNFGSTIDARIAKVLHDTGLSAKWLELEITESIMADVTYAAGMLERLKALGLRISMDDFGTATVRFNTCKNSASTSSKSTVRS
jgi:EAL domain-containing protein (putative c-di-GMP-specific phosphodiesterase class I)